jgi:cytochrome c oxidase assembly protein subunit 15
VYPVLTAGFAAAVAMWCIGFMTHLPGLRASAPVVGVAMLMAHLALGIAMARIVGVRPVRAAGAAGLVTGAINLLVLGAMLAPDDPSASMPGNAALVALGYVAASGLLGAIGAIIGRAMGVRASGVDGGLGREAWLARFAVVAALSAAPVVLSGGLVTSAEAGLAVPDWPGSYGALMWLYPLSRMTGGIYYEHAHRLFGSLVGLTVVVMTVLAFTSTRRPGPRVVAVVALLAVIAQGIMGGTRVTAADTPTDRDLTVLTPAIAPDEAPADFALTTDNAMSRGLAVAHGVFGQLTVAWLAVCAVVMSPRFGPGGSPVVGDRFLRTASACLVGALLLQLVLGATTRHLHHTHVLFTHLGFAFVVLVLCLVAGLRGAKHRGTPLRRPGMAVAHASGVQVLLGFGAMFSVLPYDRVGPEPWHAILTATMHQALGAVLIAAAAALAVWAFRLAGGASHGVRPATV